MTNKTQKFISVIKGIWSFLVDISNIISCFVAIISCIVAIISCYIAYTAVTEIISLNVEITPIVRMFQKGSTIGERIIFIPSDNNPTDSLLSKTPDGQSKGSTNPLLNIPKPNVPPSEEDESPYLSQEEVESIEVHRNSFLERTKPLERIKILLDKIP